MAGKKHCLNMRQKPNIDLLINKGVKHLILYALLICNKHGLSCIIFHHYSP
jgi:hypothetical protein